jgi:hypothetical protein
MLPIDLGELADFCKSFTFQHHVQDAVATAHLPKPFKMVVYLHLLVLSR